jgi:hypothetical protein
MISAASNFFQKILKHVWKKVPDVSTFAPAFEGRVSKSYFVRLDPESII